MKKLLIEVDNLLKEDESEKKSTKLSEIQESEGVQATTSPVKMLELSNTMTSLAKPKTPLESLKLKEPVVNEADAQSQA